MAKLYQGCSSMCNNKDFYRYDKIHMDTRSTSVRSIGISGHQIRHMSSQGVLLVLDGEQTLTGCLLRPSNVFSISAWRVPR